MWQPCAEPADGALWQRRAEPADGALWQRRAEPADGALWQRRAGPFDFPARFAASRFVQDGTRRRAAHQALLLQPAPQGGSERSGITAKGVGHGVTKPSLRWGIQRSATSRMGPSWGTPLWGGPQSQRLVSGHPACPILHESARREPGGDIKQSRTPLPQRTVGGLGTPLPLRTVRVDSPAIQVFRENEGNGEATAGRG